MSCWETIAGSQAVSGYGRSAAEWARGLIAPFSIHDRLARALLFGLVREWERILNLSEAIRIMDLFDACKTMPLELLARVEAAYETNSQLHYSAGVDRKYPGFIARMKASGRGAS